MNQDEIIAMAREAGMDVHVRQEYVYIRCAALTGVGSPDEVARFAALIAEKAVAMERESIAAHYAAQPHVEFFGAELAQEIRARGTKEG